MSAPPPALNSSTATSASRAGQELKGSETVQWNISDDATVPASRSTVLPSSPIVYALLSSHKSPDAESVSARDGGEAHSLCTPDSANCVSETANRRDGPSERSPQSATSDAAPNTVQLAKPRSHCANDTSCSASTPSQDTVTSSCYILVTREDQSRFNRKLDHLLLRLLREREEQLSHSSHTQSQDSTKSSLRSVSSSLYAADISVTHSLGGFEVSSLSGSASVSSSPSSCASLAALDDNGAPSCDSAGNTSPYRPEFANTPMAARFVYGSVSDAMDEDVEMDLIDAALSVALSPTKPGTDELDELDVPISSETPFTSSRLVTPPAPKKQHSHFYLRNDNGLSSRKRSRFTSTSDRPEQDRLQPGECMRLDSSSSGLVGRKGAYSRCGSMSPAQNDPTDGDIESKKPRLSPSLENVNQPALSQTQFLAREPASLRRAASLRSEHSNKLISTPVVKTEPNSDQNPLQSACQDVPTIATIDPGTYPPTQPATPVAQSPSKRQRRHPSFSPFPVLSPSAFGPTPCAPLSVIDAAEGRLLNLIKKELAEKIADGLIAHGGSFPGRLVSSTVDSEQELWDAVGEDVSCGDVKMRVDPAQDGDIENQKLPARRTEDLPLRLGIEEDIRVKVVEWILDVRSALH